MARSTGSTGSTGPHLRVRMYRVGFGDCFLITFPGPPPRHVLVDCGVHHGQGDIGTLGDAVENIALETRGKLALVIASHAHRDHIFGFAEHADRFREFEIGEIWLPWTEKPGDPDAGKLRRQQTALYARLKSHFAARPPSAEARATLRNLAADSNKRALDQLREGFGTGAEVSYLQAGERRERPGGIAGLSARLLGPPKDETFLKKMYVPKAQRFLRAGPGGPEPGNAIRPFEDEYLWSEEDRSAGEGSGPRLTNSEARAIRAATEAPLESLAWVLEDSMNNSSLVILFSYRGEHLLFPGDAQYGNWKHWIEQEEADELLPRVSFYKVSHHGSWNATPKSALERMSSTRLAAMISTQSQPWPSIPDPKLLKALQEQAEKGVVRSDSLSMRDAPEAPPTEIPIGFRDGPLWFDYLIPV